MPLLALASHDSLCASSSPPPPPPPRRAPLSSSATCRIVAKRRQKPRSRSPQTRRGPPERAPLLARCVRVCARVRAGCGARLTAATSPSAVAACAPARLRRLSRRADAPRGTTTSNTAATMPDVAIFGFLFASLFVVQVEIAPFLAFLCGEGGQGRGGADAGALAAAMVKEQVIGLDVRPGVGQRVIMANTRDRWRGEGTISSVHASGGYCGVRWDSGHLDVCLFTGMQNEYHLVAAGSMGPGAAGDRVPPEHTAAPTALPTGYDLWLPKADAELHETFNTYAHRSHDTHYNTACLPCERMRAESRHEPATQRDGGALESYTTASLRYQDEDDSDLQKLILAQEVVKLRAEVARLEAQKVHEQAGEGTLAAVRDEILMLQARKAETIEKREVDKKLLRLEIQKLLQEAALISGKERWADTRASGWKERVQHAYDLQAHELDALHLLVDQAASEDDFVQVVRTRQFLGCMHSCHTACGAGVPMCANRIPECAAPIDPGTNPKTVGSQMAKSAKLEITAGIPRKPVVISGFALSFAFRNQPIFPFQKSIPAPLLPALAATS